jgi:hypothetical protein
VAVLLSLLLSLAACYSSKPPQGIVDISCETLTANGLADMMLETTTQPKLAGQIAATFDVTPGGEYWEQTIDGDMRRLFYYRWDVAQTKFGALMTDDTLTYLAMAFDDRAAQPALSRVIDCFGSPDYYFIRYDQAPDAFRPYYVMNFYYTSQGIYFSTVVTAPQLETSGDLVLLNQPVAATIPIGAIEWVAPGDVRELDWQVANPFGPYVDHNGKTVGKEEFWQMRSDRYEHVQPWPGSIEQLRVTWIPLYMLPPTPTPPPPPPVVPQ